jgi:hypothetical protein
MRHGRRYQIIGLAALAGLIIVGCQGAAPATPTQVALLPPTVVPTAPATPPPAAANDSASTATPTPRPVRTALEATDPTTVSLAVGRPTFVEFFAFW